MVADIKRMNGKWEELGIMPWTGLDRECWWSAYAPLRGVTGVSSKQKVYPYQSYL